MSSGFILIYEKGGGLLERFDCGTKIRAGAGAIAALGELGAKRVFVVTDPFFWENGMARQVAQAAGAEETEFFSRITPDPSVELAAEGTARLREFQPELLVALGGGSAMDCAKAMHYFGGGNELLAAIPTTSGSGAEVTDFAILTHDRGKHPLVDPRLRPDLAILDSDLLKALPPTLVADGGFDILSHALEACVAANAGAISDALARDAFAAAFAALPASFAGRGEVRLRIHVAATMAGMAFSQAGLGLCHAVSHCLGGLFHIPHGRLNAILLPAVVGINAMTAQDRYAALARSAGLGGSSDTVAVRNLKNGLIRLRRELRLPATLAEAGVAPREVWQNVERIVRGALEDPCCATNPMKADDFLIRRILEEVTGRV